VNGTLRTVLADTNATSTITVRIKTVRSAPPMRDPSKAIDMAAPIHRRRTVTGLISEYHRAA
jgi:hypothetical protein